MKIVADSAIPFVDIAFGPFGELVKLESKSIDNLAVRDADAVIVRSETKIDEKLLIGSKVQFVGTATIGTDHVDIDFLRNKGITFASAPGAIRMQWYSTYLPRCSPFQRGSISL